MSETKPNPDQVREIVRQGYARIASGENAAPQSPTAGGCCGPSASPCAPAADPASLAQQIGYAAGEVSSLPEGANLGLSCGNPTAIAALRAGEIVLDLGSGAGMDAFLAGPKVGARGRVIGVDMTAEMIAKARSNLAVYRRRTGLDNVEFRLGEIEHLPVADASVDVVISNCVLNLSPDKPQVWREIARVLKPNGRVAVSDLALLRPLPQAILTQVEALIGCVAGAVLVEEMRRMIGAAGLVDVQLTPKPDYVAAMTNLQDPLYREMAAQLPSGASIADYVTSLEVAARK